MTSLKSFQNNLNILKNKFSDEILVRFDYLYGSKSYGLELNKLLKINKYDVREKLKEFRKINRKELDNLIIIKENNNRFIKGSHIYGKDNFMIYDKETIKNKFLKYTVDDNEIIYINNFTGSHISEDEGMKCVITDYYYLFLKTSEILNFENILLNSVLSSEEEKKVLELKMEEKKELDKKNETIIGSFFMLIFFIVIIYFMVK